MTITLRPQNPLTSECLMIGDDGTPTLLYGTAATEANHFVFHDPLPQGAIVTGLSVAISSMASCQPSPDLSVKLNPDRDGVIDFFKDLGTLSPVRTLSCTTPTRFFALSVFAPNLVFPDTPLYLSGGENTIAVTEVGANCGSVRIEYVSVTISYYVNLPFVVFDPIANADDAKVIMHRWRSDYDYLSTLQGAVQPASARDHSVVVRGTAYDAHGTPFAGQTIYLRTADPPDPSPYLPAGMSHDSDNPFGWEAFPVHDAWDWAAVGTDLNGRFEVIMPMMEQFAGDNQEVEASAVPLHYVESPTRCKSDLACSRSPAFTNWRRVYIERDRMFRSGAFISVDAIPGATKVRVTDGRPFRGAKASNPIPVLFIHSSVLDPNGQSGAEVRNVIKVTGGKRFPTLILDAPLTLAYVERISSFDPSLESGDAVGVFHSDADVFPSYIDPSIEFFKGMYTDLRVLKDGSENVMQYVPFVAQCPSDDYCGEVAGIWFDNRDHDTSARNHVHFVAAAADSDAGRLGVNLMNGGVLPYSSPEAIFVFNASIQAAVADASNPDVGGSDPVAVTNQVTAHELVHTFDVNQPARLTSGHCTAHGFAGGLCLMNESRSKADRASATFSLHVDPWASSEYRRVRRGPEPLPLMFQHDVDPNP
ncbi:MAG TPA: hypothetical protein VNN08_12175 [Thermoanaerobaculia bacterium]|nr:hypothetical protein [Thermoanaerobaculia bacterium]